MACDKDTPLGSGPRGLPSQLFLEKPSLDHLPGLFKVISKRFHVNINEILLGMTQKPPDYKGFRVYISVYGDGYCFLVYYRKNKDDKWTKVEIDHTLNKDEILRGKPLDHSDQNS